VVQFDFAYVTDYTILDSIYASTPTTTVQTMKITPQQQPSNAMQARGGKHSSHGSCDGA